MRKLVFAIAVFGLFRTLAPAQPLTPAGVKKVDPCALVSKADIEQAVGSSAGDPKPNASNAAVCDFKVGDYGTVGLMTQRSRPGETPDKIIAELKKRNIPVSNAPGIGDRSFFTSPGYGMNQLNTFKGSNYLIITLLIPGAGEEKQKAIAEKVMRKALAKL
jgi:hypothetical protein